MRIGNDLAAGFYPTPLTEGKYLIQLLQMESERAYACFDPCCGEGAILRSFADEVKQAGIQLSTLNCYFSPGCKNAGTGPCSIRYNSVRDICILFFFLHQNLNNCSFSILITHLL